MGTLKARELRRVYYGDRKALATMSGRKYKVVAYKQKVKNPDGTVVFYGGCLIADELRRGYQQGKKATKLGAIHHRQESNERTRKKALWCINRERLRIKRKELKKRHKRAEG